MEIEKNNQIISVGEWMVILLITSIPVVNIIMLFLWTFSNRTPASKSNFAKASLIWLAISYILLFILLWRYALDFVL